MLDPYLFSHPATWIYQRLLCFCIMASSTDTIQYAIAHQIGQSLLTFASAAVVLHAARALLSREG